MSIALEVNLHQLIFRLESCFAAQGNYLALYIYRSRLQAPQTAKMAHRRGACHHGGISGVGRIKILIIVFAVLVQNLAAVWSLVPPYPNATAQPFERVHDTRRRLNQGFKYTTKFVDAEMCRDLTEEECAEQDRMMKRHAQAHKNLAKQLHLRSGENPSLGKINVSL